MMCVRIRTKQAYRVETHAKQRTHIILYHFVQNGEVPVQTPLPSGMLCPRSHGNFASVLSTPDWTIHFILVQKQSKCIEHQPQPLPDAKSYLGSLEV